MRLLLHSSPRPLTPPIHTQAYVIDYNIYVVEVRGNGDPVPITLGGSKDGTVYGIPDWVYEGQSAECPMYT